MCVTQCAIKGVKALESDRCKVTNLCNGLVGRWLVSRRGPFILKLDPWRVISDRSLKLEEPRIYSQSVLCGEERMNELVGWIVSIKS